MFPVFNYSFLCFFLVALASYSLADENIIEPVLSWYPNSLLTKEQQAEQYSFCRGRYIPEDITPLNTDNIEASANYSEIKLNKQVKLSGEVIFLQKDRILYSDEAIWNMQTSEGEFNGNTRLVNPEITIESNQVSIKQSKDNGQSGIKDVHFSKARYSLPKEHLRGESEGIQMPDKTLMIFDDNTFTYCEPGNNDWDLRSSEVEIDYTDGVARSWHTRLRISEVPIFYFPYFSFPIDDRRITGFLSPEITFNESLSIVDVQLPFYLNLYANLDATFTTHYIKEQGILWESEVRHKTKLFGDGQLDYNYMGENEYNPKKRWLLSYQQSGSMVENLTHRVDFTQVSDNEYFNDMNSLEQTNRDSYLTQKIQFDYKRDYWQSYLLAEQFQTINDNIALKDRPYFRLPQARLSYTPITYNNFQFQHIIEATYFTRDHEKQLNNGKQSLAGLDAIDSQRFLLDSSVSYPLKRTYGFLEPKLGLRYRLYQLDNMDANYHTKFGQQKSVKQLFAPKFTLDSGLFFERIFSINSHSMTQTLEPRVMWTYSPKVDDQFLIPAFDTSNQAMTYASIFSGDRFNGGDRLADLNQISTGISSAFLDASGREVWRFNLGQIQYLRDREVQLKGQNISLFDQRSQSNLLAEIKWRPTPHWEIFSHFDYDPYLGVLAQQRYGINYENDKNQMLNLGLNRVRDYSSSEDAYNKKTYQLDMSAFWAITDSWAVFARQLRDLQEYKKSEFQPVNPVLEAMLGLEYQNCCWKIQALYKESSPVKRLGGEEFSTDKQVSYLLNFQFKGLGTVGSSINSLLKSTINGYSRRRYHDY